MPQISDPDYSRPFDVHRWSDHPEVNGVVDDLWEEWLPVTCSPWSPRSLVRSVQGLVLY